MRERRKEPREGSEIDPVFQTIEQLLTEWKQIIEQLQESDSASSSEQSTPPEDSNTASGTSN